VQTLQLITAKKCFMTAIRSNFNLEKFAEAIFRQKIETPFSVSGEAMTQNGATTFSETTLGRVTLGVM
jgi:hypothetical protein